nr:MAG TPA: hypothetical protein [Caudoviricetes sp.]
MNPYLYGFVLVLVVILIVNCIYRTKTIKQ